MIGAVLAAAFTAIENGCNDALACPSLTLMMMLSKVPTLLAVGAPESRPVVALKPAQDGLLEIENVSGLPSASEAAGWKVYDLPTRTDFGGLPAMFGVRFGLGCLRASTRIEKAVSSLLSCPSLTLITTSSASPTSPSPGVPVTVPELASKLAQAGRPVT